MREIKFRAWDSALKHWDSHPCNGIDFNGKLWFGNAEIDGYPLILEQYTGLRDVKGKEIYEGDIVRGDTRYFVEKQIGVVSFGGMAFNFSSKEWFYTVSDPYITTLPEIEVIGNIHENLELLK